MSGLRSSASWTRLASALYEGVGERDFLTRMTVAVNNGMSMGVTQWSRLDRASLKATDTVWSRPSPASLYSEYERHYAVHDPRITAAFEKFGQFLPCWRLVDAGAFERSVIVNEWSDRKDVDTRWTAVCIWGVDDENLGLLALCRPRKDGPIQLDELKIVKRLRSHVRRAAQLHFLFRGEPRGRAFDDAWCSRSRPVFLLGKGRRILAVNEAGQDLLSMGDVFQTRWGELTARTPRLLAALDNALAAARRFDLDIHPRPLAVAWPRLGGLTTLKVEVMALPGVAAELGLGERADAILMCREVPHRAQVTAVSRALARQV
jgi:hypothetical protein